MAICLVLLRAQQWFSICDSTAKSCLKLKNIKEKRAYKQQSTYF